MYTVPSAPIAADELTVPPVAYDQTGAPSGETA